MAAIVLAFAIAASAASAGNHPVSFLQAKRVLDHLYETTLEPVTFYCGCEFSGRSIRPEKCGYEPRKQPSRGERLKWEHVVPAWEIGHQRQCWRIGGRSHCRKTDPYFEVMTSDLHNLKPSVGELNGDRSNYRYGMVAGEPRAYGACDFEVDFNTRRAEPPASRQGDVARVYFYMRDRYGLRISRQQSQLFEAWSKIDPVDQREFEENAAITILQGNSNCYVSGDCQIERVSGPAPE